jgi:Protein of unknown function (DUF1064)
MYYARKANKYGAKKTEYQGRLYDSKHEAGIAQEMNLLVKAGEVVRVEPQRTFVLYGKNGGKIRTHRPDFLLTFKDGHQEVWGAKGFPTPTWQLKLKLFTDNYPDLTYIVITPKETCRYGYKPSKHNTGSTGRRLAA